MSLLCLMWLMWLIDPGTVLIRVDADGVETDEVAAISRTGINNTEQNDDQTNRLGERCNL